MIQAIVSGAACATLLLTLTLGCNRTRSVATSSAVAGLLEAHLSPQFPKYVLPDDIDAIRSRLPRNDPARWKIPGAALPLNLRLTNASDRVVRIAYPSDCYWLRLEIKGPGAIVLFAPNSLHVLPPDPGEPIGIVPGASYVVHVPMLQLEQRPSSWRAFLTRAGEVEVRAHFVAICTTEELDPVSVTSNWAKIPVVD